MPKKKDMPEKYPVERPCSAPATGSEFYQFLMKNAKIPASATHEIWYAGEAAKLKSPENHAFRGPIPIGSTLQLVGLAKKSFDCERSYTFTGKEQHVFVCNLAPSERERLGIPQHAGLEEKVFNRNFRPYNKLDKLTKLSNELAALSVPKSMSNYFAEEGILQYSELDIAEFLDTCIRKVNCPQMMQLLRTNNVAWTSIAYMRDKQLAGDALREFHGNNSTDYYMKDLGTILPTLFFAAANLGIDPVKYHEKLDVEVWGAKDAAEYMRQFMRHPPAKESDK